MFSISKLNHYLCVLINIIGLDRMPLVNFFIALWSFICGVKSQTRSCSSTGRYLPDYYAADTRNITLSYDNVEIQRKKCQIVTIAYTDFNVCSPFTLPGPKPFRLCVEVLEYNSTDCDVKWTIDDSHSLCSGYRRTDFRSRVVMPCHANYTYCSAYEGTSLVMKFVADTDTNTYFLFNIYKTYEKSRKQRPFDSSKFLYFLILLGVVIVAAICFFQYRSYKKNRESDEELYRNVSCRRNDNMMTFSHEPYQIRDSRAQRAPDLELENLRQYSSPSPAYESVVNDRGSAYLSIPTQEPTYEQGLSQTGGTVPFDMTFSTRFLSQGLTPSLEPEFINTQGNTQPGCPTYTDAMTSSNNVHSDAMMSTINADSSQNVTGEAPPPTYAEALQIVTRSDL